MPEEIWKDIPGHEGQYQVSNRGRVRSLPRLVTCERPNGRRFTRRYRGFVLKPGRMSGGHLSVVLGKHTGSRTVHSLVAEAFIGPRPNGKEVCHNDGDHTNNCVENLRYDTRKENLLDEYRAGRGARSRVTPETVRAIRAELATKKKGRAIAREFGVSEYVVSEIKTGRSWSWVT